MLFLSLFILQLKIAKWPPCPRGRSLATVHSLLQCHCNWHFHTSQHKINKCATYSSQFRVVFVSLWAQFINTCVPFSFFLFLCLFLKLWSVLGQFGAAGSQKLNRCKVGHSKHSVGGWGGYFRRAHYFCPICPCCTTPCGQTSYSRPLETPRQKMWIQNTHLSLSSMTDLFTRVGIISGVILVIIKTMQYMPM